MQLWTVIQVFPPAVTSTICHRFDDYAPEILKSALSRVRDCLISSLFCLSPLHFCTGIATSPLRLRQTGVSELLRSSQTPKSMQSAEA